MEPFDLPADVLDHCRSLTLEHEKDEKEWDDLYQGWSQANPDQAKSFDKALRGEDLDGVELDELVALAEQDEATRVTSGRVLNYLAGKTPYLFGGSADLGPSNNTVIKGGLSFSHAVPQGSTIHFGVRELAMAAIGNGIALHSGLRPYVATFLVFSDYLKGSIRLSALMELPVIYILTHDSIAVGEDGPTHQPIEHLNMLRSTPGVTVYRPAGRHETAAAWLHAVHNRGPSVLALSRQAIPSAGTDPSGVARGAYLARDCQDPDLLMIASGSELPLSLAAAELLEGEGIKARVVSMVSMEVFEQQDKAYREEILPPAMRKRLAVEAGSAIPWYRYTGLDGKVLGIDRFGASAPGARMMEEYGFTAEDIARAARELFSGEETSGA